jgi:hypothetical protein
MIHGLDVGGWIAWCLGGLALFANPQPPYSVIRRESKRIPMALAMLRSRGNLSEATGICVAAQLSWPSPTGAQRTTC